MIEGPAPTGVGPSSLPPAGSVWCCLISPRFLLIVGSFIAAIALTSFITSEISSRRSDSARQSLAVALSSLKQATSRAVIAEHQASIEAARADSAHRSVVMYELVAKGQTKRASEAWARFEAAVKENHCDSSCINAARSSHLSDSIALVATQSALAAEKIAAARYKLGLDQALSALVELREQSTKVAVVAKPFTKPPSRLRQLLPKFGVSAAAGLDLSGKPNVVIGPSLSYSF